MQAFREPPLNLRGLDRLLLLGLAAGIPSVIVINKRDLLHGGRPQALEFYASVASAVVDVSVRQGHGLAEVAKLLTNRTSVIVGPSGAGKTSLLNALVPGSRLRVGAVSDATSRGVHTTTRVEWIDLPGGGVVLDTPGLRSIQPWGVDPERLGRIWPEFSPASTCRFPDCRHRMEPGCEVRAWVETGRLPAFRYDSYLRVLASMEAAVPTRRGFSR
jgi:ribosome biogenesis GTPase